MSAPTKVNYKIYQGSTFSEVLRWESYEKSYANITGISKAAPAVITVAAATLPVGWRIKVSGVVGMKEINTDDYHIVTENTLSAISINLLNTSNYSTYVSGGTIEYFTPKSLSGYTAQMQIREKITSVDPILELTTENGGILINDGLKTITITMTAEQTRLLSFKTAVYSLELIKGVTITSLTKGNLVLETEITR